jgi:hypothetical protein
MIEALRVLMNMGSLRRLFPIWGIGMILLVSQFSAVLMLAVIYGVVAQFFVEYIMHRFLYHRDPPSDQSVFNDLYRTHIGHHEFPNNPEFFTGGDHWFALKFGFISVAIHSLVLWIFFPFFDALIWSSIAIFVGSISAFTFYEYCHTLAHINVPKGWFGRQVTHSHLRHHFNDHESNFHVSFGMGWIDGLFGTRYDRDQAKDRFDRETILSLGMNPEDLRLVTARKAFGLPEQPSAKTD